MVDSDHETRAVAAIARAFREIPYYVQKERKVPSATTPLNEVLAGAPLLFKKHLRMTLPKHWVPVGRDAKAELAAGELELVETSGSTEERLRILWDKGWWLRQEARAMRTNAVVDAAMSGAIGAYKEAILTTPACGLGTCHTGDLSFEERMDDPRLFLNMRSDPMFWRPDDMARMLDEITRHGTIGMESDPVYLAVLAGHAVATNRKIDVRGFIQLTYAFTTRAHLRSIRRAYAGPLFQIYGASEVGVLFMEGEDGLLHHSPLTTHVELLRVRVPTPGAKDVALIVVTSLDRSVQPLVRFVVGDLVQVKEDGPRRFTTVAPLASIEGRVQDALFTPKGELVTAGAIDRALGSIEELAQFQVNQPSPEKVDVDVLLTAEGTEETLSRVREALTPLCAGAALNVRKVTAIAAEPSGKFRAVRRHFPIDFALCFEGCEGVTS
jgi:phenylacetate-coenzyme A ligase PaaK-like adenylate-forming protein